MALAVEGVHQGAIEACQCRKLIGKCLAKLLLCLQTCQRPHKVRDDAVHHLCADQSVLPFKLKDACAFHTVSDHGKELFANLVCTQVSHQPNWIQSAVDLPQCGKQLALKQELHRSAQDQLEWYSKELLNILAGEHNDVLLRIKTEQKAMPLNAARGADLLLRTTFKRCRGNVRRLFRNDRGADFDWHAELLSYAASAPKPCGISPGARTAASLTVTSRVSQCWKMPNICFAAAMTGPLCASGNASSACWNSRHFGMVSFP